MNETLLFIIAMMVGTIAGCARTYFAHGMKLIQPEFTIRGRSIKFKLGWLASAVLALAFTFIALTSVPEIIPDFSPESTYETLLLAMGTGWLSLEAFNRWAGRKFGDLDTREFDFEFEVNLQKQNIVRELLKNVKGLERVLIRDEMVGGMIEVLIVPKPGTDATLLKLLVEKFFAKYRRLGTLVQVKLPEMVRINVELTAVVLDSSPIANSEYVSKIGLAIREYIDGLSPGVWVNKMQIVKLALMDRFVTDVVGLKTYPSIAGDRISISEFQVAKAGAINVSIKKALPYREGY